ncbi:uncharacterized protein LOC112342605 [Selaginella moellendorffii]|uniref:uncharacterized protein LOC112342605 n=1 Tax=Selaginella moellendorffii TaxID=88036 RepID=UPI000D1CF61B|nr:uncharacterized protein LOC112342605 [Selaginella moellendorffii]|eukprot:XP_024520444.1 uncharacterized protein LOC112342605 [Selaginella moellendorffii]
MEFVGRFQALVRNVAVALEKPNKERSKCPRCKGSGFLAQRAPWDWSRGTVSNDPCWFCEGIGVMPVAGLTGFLLARASPAFHTRDIKAPSQLPIKVQLYLGKYPGTRPKFSTHKVCDNPKALLHDFSRVPDWLCGEEFQHLETPRAPKTSMASGGTLSPRTTPVTGTRRGSSSLFRTKSSTQPRPDGGVPRFSRQLGMASSTPRSSPPAYGTRSPSSSPKERQTPVVLIPVPSTLESPKDTVEAEDAGAPKSVRFARRNPRHFKAPRRERNRIREEAEKEAVERARRSVQSGPGATEMEKQDQAGAPSSGPTLWSLNDPSKPSSSWAWASKLPLPPWLEPWKRSSLGKHFWVNQMVYGSLKDRTAAPLSPMPSKAFL